MFLDMIEDEGLRAIVGSFMLAVGMVCIFYCVYKYAVCQEDINRRNNIYPSTPRVYTSVEVRPHYNGLIVIPSQPSQQLQSSQQNDKFIGMV